jgi:hypothetical protein
MHGFRLNLVLADACVGHDRNIIYAIPKGLDYFVSLHATDKLFTEWPSYSIPGKKPGGKGKKPRMPKPNISPQNVKTIIENSPTPKDSCRVWA